MVGSALLHFSAHRGLGWGLRHPLALFSSLWVPGDDLLVLGGQALVSALQR